MYPTIPHTSSSPAGRRMALAVDDAPELALRQGGRREPALPELGRDQRPDLVVLVPAGLEFGVAPADEVLDRLAEVRRHVGDDPDRGRLRQAGRGGQVAREVLREGVRQSSGTTGARHAPLLTSRTAVRARNLPESGQEMARYGGNRPTRRRTAAPRSA